MLFNYSIRREVRLLIPRLPEWESKNLAKLGKIISTTIFQNTFVYRFGLIIPSTSLFQKCIFLITYQKYL